MITIESVEQLEAVSGGMQAADRIKCKATASQSPSLECEFTAGDIGRVIGAVFNELNIIGGKLGIWLYDVTH